MDKKMDNTFIPGQTRIPASGQRIEDEDVELQGNEVLDRLGQRVSPAFLLVVGAAGLQHQAHVDQEVHHAEHLTNQRGAEAELSCWLVVIDKVFSFSNGRQLPVAVKWPVPVGSLVKQLPNSLVGDLLWRILRLWRLIFKFGLEFGFAQQRDLVDLDFFIHPELDDDADEQAKVHPLEHRQILKWVALVLCKGALVARPRRDKPAGYEHTEVEAVIRRARDVGAHNRN